MTVPSTAARFAPLGLSALLLGGCTTGTAPPAPASSAELHGHLVLGPRLSAFRPCGSADSLWLEAASPLDAQLDATYLEQAGGPYEEAYLRLRARQVAVPADCAPCREHAGMLHLEQLLELRAAAADDCR